MVFNFSPIKIIVEKALTQNYMLLILYVIFFISMVTSDDIFMAHRIFLYFVAPVALIPIGFKKDNTELSSFFPKATLSLNNITTTLTGLRTPLFCATIVYVISISLSTTLIPEPSLIWLSSMIYFGLPLLIFVLITARLFSEVENFITLFTVTVGTVTTLATAFNLYNYFSKLNEFADFSAIRLVPIFGQATGSSPNSSGLFFAIFFFIALTTTASVSTKLSKISCLVSAAIFFLALLLTQSRSALVGLFVTLLIFGAITSRHTQRLIYLTLFLAITVFFSVPKISSDAFHRQDNQRIEIWQKFIPLALERPVFGYGERITFNILIKNGEIVPQAHNLILNAQILGGLPASMALIFIFCYGLHRGYSYFRSSGIFLPLGLLIILAMAGLVDFRIELLTANWAWATFWFPVGLCVGADLKLRQEPSRGLLQH